MMDSESRNGNRKRTFEPAFSVAEAFPPAGIADIPGHRVAVPCFADKNTDQYPKNASFV